MNNIQNANPMDNQSNAKSRRKRQQEYPDYINEKEHLKEFVKNFEILDEIKTTTEDDTAKSTTVTTTTVVRKKYMDYLQMVADKELTLVEIELSDIEKHFANDVYVKNIKRNGKRYLIIFSEIFDELMPPSSKNLKHKVDIIDHLIAQTNERRSELPQELIRRYEISIIPSIQNMQAGGDMIPLRSIRAVHIGKLLNLKGVVTRVSDVKPELEVATYICDKCTTETYQVIEERDFKPISTCSKCAAPSTKQRSDDQGNVTEGINRVISGLGGTLTLLTRGSKFVKFQEIMIQETSDEVPIGSIPRALRIYARGELVNRCSPGDHVLVSGIFLQTPTSGFAAITQARTNLPYLHAMYIDRHKKRYEEMEQFEHIVEVIQNDREVMSDNQMYERLARSIAPEIYGHLDVKKALLLMMVSGVTRHLSKGVKIRGDINVCLMGDPGVAKSQLLRYVAMVSPRGIYTSGKSSSGVGLTAAIVKDNLTSELVLEGGALVLADNGICCIDEFDKMNDFDRTALHEVMEQQSVSIAKAGITTTLNARSSVLAAANPAYGRYNIRKSPTENINMPAALLSRFDLLFLLIDRQDREADARLSRHILQVHLEGRAPQLNHTVDLNYLRCYISMTRKIEPMVPPHLIEYISEMYVDMREADSRDENTKEYTTPRALLAVLRLAQALSRLRFSKEVSREDVEEAKRLIVISKASLVSSSDNQDAIKMVAGADRISQIFDLIGMARRGLSQTVQLRDIEAGLMTRRLTQADVEKCLDTYAAIQVWRVNEDRQSVTFL